MKANQRPPIDKRTLAIVAAVLHVGGCLAGKKRTPQEAIAAAGKLLEMVEEYANEHSVSALN